jgi:hypothetical protein
LGCEHFCMCLNERTLRRLLSEKALALVGEERNQALTVRAEALFVLQLGWHHGIKLSSLVMINKGWEFFYLP